MHGVNQLRISLSRFSDSIKSPKREMDPRSSRNRERTWLTTVLLERTHSTFVENTSSHILAQLDWKALRRWSDEAGALPGDVALAGYLHMRHLEVSIASPVARTSSTLLTFILLAVPHQRPDCQGRSAIRRAGVDREH